MKFTHEDLKNLSVLLGVGKWELTARDSTVLLNLLNKVNDELKSLETQPEGEVK